MIQIGHHIRTIGGLFLILLLCLFCRCAPVINRNVMIENAPGAFHKKISFQRYGLIVLTVGIKSFNKKERKYINLYSKDKTLLFVAKNETGGNLIFENISVMKNYNNYLNQTNHIPFNEKTFTLFNEKKIKVLEKNYVVKNKILIKDIIFNHKDNVLLYQIQVHKTSNTVRYNFDRYIEQIFEGINLE